MGTRVEKESSQGEVIVGVERYSDGSCRLVVGAMCVVGSEKNTTVAVMPKEVAPTFLRQLSEAATEIGLVMPPNTQHVGLLRRVLGVLDAGRDFQCGPKGKDLWLREEIRGALATADGLAQPEPEVTEKTNAPDTSAALPPLYSADLEVLRRVENLLYRIHTASPAEIRTVTHDVRWRIDNAQGREKR